MDRDESAGGDNAPEISGNIEMKTSIALIGFMGSGKSLTGVNLARRLKKKFLETDSLIEQKAGKPIPAIFSEDGEAAFRQIETEIAAEVAAEENAVIACGGGMVLNKINMDRLRGNAVIVYLDVDPDIILKRLINSGDKRPLLNTPDRKQRIIDLLKQRKPLYEREADIRVAVDKIDADTAQMVIKALKANASIDI
jgi:shikimate kinase